MNIIYKLFECVDTHDTLLLRDHFSLLVLNLMFDVIACTLLMQLAAVHIQAHMPLMH